MKTIGRFLFISNLVGYGISLQNNDSFIELNLKPVSILNDNVIHRNMSYVLFAEYYYKNKQVSIIRILASHPLDR